MGENRKSFSETNIKIPPNYIRLSVENLNIYTVKPGYKDLGYKDNLTNKDTILGPEYICMRNKDNPIPLNILLIGRSLASKHTKFSLT